MKKKKGYLVKYWSRHYRHCDTLKEARDWGKDDNSIMVEKIEEAEDPK